MTGRTVLVVHPSVELYGSDRMLLEAVVGLQEDGWRCVVVLPGEGPLTAAARELGVGVRVLPTPVLRKTSMSATGVVRHALDLARALPRVLGLLREVSPDTVYVSTLTVPLWLAAARLRRRTVVCHVHEAESAVPRAVRWALTAPLLLADVVLANSAASRDVLLAEVPRLSARTRVVYNGVPGPDRPVSPRPVLDGVARLVLVGRVSPRKGTDVAVSALGRLVDEGHDVCLHLVGGVFPGYEWFEEQIRRQVVEAGLEERVVWRGERPDPYAELAAADIALVPSRVEPFGNTAVEALLARRPLVASRTQGLTEIVTSEEVADLVDPEDAAGLAAAVGALMTGWPAAVRRSEQAAVTAAGRFSPARYRSDVAAAVLGATSGR